MRALEPWMMDAAEVMCEGEFPRGLRDGPLAGYGVGSAWEAGTVGPGDRCPNFGHDEPHVDCCSCGVTGRMVPENLFFPTGDVFDAVVRERLLATGFLPIGEPFRLEPADENEIPF